MVVLTRAGQPAAEVERLFECARMLAPDERLVAVVSGGDGPLRTTVGPPMVVEAPGDAACMLLATAYVLARHPDATLLFLPCRLELHAEPHLLRHLVASSLYAKRFPNDIILLGEPRRGGPGDATGEALWLEVQRGAPSPLPQPLLRAWPPSGGNGNGNGHTSRAPMPRPGGLLTTGCFSAWGPTLWQVARRCLPDLADRCDELRLVLRAIGDGRMAGAEEERVLSRLGAVGEARLPFLATLLAKAPESARVLALQPTGVSA